MDVNNILPNTTYTLSASKITNISSQDANCLVIITKGVETVNSVYLNKLNSKHGVTFNTLDGDKITLYSESNWSRNTVRIEQLKLELGSIVTPYIPNINSMRRDIDRTALYEQIVPNEYYNGQQVYCKRIVKQFHLPASGSIQIDVDPTLVVKDFIRCEGNLTRLMSDGRNIQNPVIYVYGISEPISYEFCSMWKDLNNKIQYYIRFYYYTEIDFLLDTIIYYTLPN